MKESTNLVGIDFGTTKTMAARYEPVRGNVRTIRLGRGKDEMPTCLYPADGGSMLFGDDADDEGMTDMMNHATRFKMKLGLPGPAHVGRFNGTACDLTSHFLKHVKTKLEGQALHGALDSVVLTVPAMFGPAQRKDLKEAARLAGFSQMELLHEPVAAAIAYCHQYPLATGKQKILVVDWGGGTLDVAMVDHKAGEAPEIDPDLVRGRDDIGGECFDDDLWKVADKGLADAGYGSLSSQGREHWGRYRRGLKTAKEDLSSREAVRVTFVLDGGLPGKVTCTRLDFEGIVMERLLLAAELVKEICETSSARGGKPDFILLAGGTCRIPAVQKTFEQVTGLSCRSWTEGREAIALGAAIHANHLWGKKAVQTNAGSKNDSDKFHAMAQYRGLLEVACLDGQISPEERVFLGKRRKKLGLTVNEARSLQKQVLGRTKEKLFQNSPVQQIYGGSNENADKVHAMEEYRGLLETVWLDGKISPNEIDLLIKLNKKLGLTQEETSSLQKQVMGRILVEIVQPPLASSQDADKETHAEGGGGNLLGFLVIGILVITIALIVLVPPIGIILAILLLILLLVLWCEPTKKE